MLDEAYKKLLKQIDEMAKIQWNGVFLTQPAEVADTNSIKD
jgi:hypothetical protein